jgi:DNA modification methylase
MAKNTYDQGIFDMQPAANRQGPVECLGMTFENDEERREYFLDKLRGKLKDPEFRKIEGFPIGSDEDILALSDPPYYTACPNPFIADFINHYAKPYDPTKPYSREPFAADVSEGKNDPIYNAHSYHTKVPHKAIMRYILHYTEPGDVVFDGFCGTGMTGVAGQLCEDKATLESLGYEVEKDGTISQQLTDENGKTIWKPFSKLGMRRTILNDLSPGATFIAHRFNIRKPPNSQKSVASLLAEVESECGWMYCTRHTGWESGDRRVRSSSADNPVNDRERGNGSVNFVLWSDVFICANCAAEVVLWHAAANAESATLCDQFMCPRCRSIISKGSMERIWVTEYDIELGQTVQRAKSVPVLINYTYSGKTYEKVPESDDLALIEKTRQVAIPYSYPVAELHKGDKTGDPLSVGITHAHQFHSRRNLNVLAKTWHMAQRVGVAAEFLFTSTLPWATKQNRLLVSNYFKKSGGVIGQTLSGTLYISSISVETNAIHRLRLRASSSAHTASGYGAIVSTQSATALPSLKNESVDYVFTDPPFGQNLVYSDLNFLLEAWLRVRTTTLEEAIVSRAQRKDLGAYGRIMEACFREYHRVLKPGRWMTVEFHNSRSSVWMAIQQAIGKAGFVVADVSTLEKTHGTFNQVTAAGAVRKDLAISAYKPNGGLEDRFRLEAGTEDGVWDFVRTHLKQLPVFVSKDGQAEIILERQNYLLFDRMVAFHVQRSVTIPLSAAEFYAGLAQRLSERDGMYFVPEQVAEYDKKRMKMREAFQLQLFVTDESSAIQWLKQQLTQRPQTFQELHPQFLKEVGGWQKHEKPLELSELLEQNFLRYDGKGEVPNQIHSYLSTNFKELRNLRKDDESLRAKGKDRWFVPDPNKAGDLEKLRERSLLKEFEDYRASSQKRLKVFRVEAVRAGFKKAWQGRDYATIITVARKIPENVLQEDPKLLMWYDQALTRSGED